jgi:hypothetical protein
MDSFKDRFNAIVFEEFEILCKWIVPITFHFFNLISTNS